MSIQLKTRTIIYLVLGLLALSFSSGYIISCRRTDRASTLALHAKDSIITEYKVKLKGMEATAYQVTQIVETQRKALRLGELKNTELRALNLKFAYEVTRMKFKVDSLMNVPHNGQIITLHDTVYKERNAILLPFEFKKKDAYLDLTGKFDNSGKLSVSLMMNLDVDVYSGLSRKLHKPIAVVTTQNPYFRAINVTSVKMDENLPKKWGIGLIGGYGIGLYSSPKLIPFLGIGVSRNIIRF
jgi:hypothetical protein